MEAINYAISPEAQARLLDLGIYGLVLGEAAAKGTPEQRKFMVTAPENIKNMLILNEQRAALYSAKYENDWSRMQLE
jgi:putative spermidine/putrescine transport system substrate-binding protein